MGEIQGEVKRCAITGNISQGLGDPIRKIIFGAQSIFMVKNNNFGLKR